MFGPFVIVYHSFRFEDDPGRTIAFVDKVYSCFASGGHKAIQRRHAAFVLIGADMRNCLPPMLSHGGLRDDNKCHNASPAASFVRAYCCQ